MYVFKLSFSNINNAPLARHDNPKQPFPARLYAYMCLNLNRSLSCTSASVKLCDVGQSLCLRYLYKREA